MPPKFSRFLKISNIYLNADDCDKTNSTAQADDDGKHKKHKFYKKLQENSLERCLSSSLDSSTPPPLVPLTPPLAPLMPPSEIIPTPSLSSPIPIPSLPQLQDENNQWMLKLENTILGPFNHVLMSAYYASGKLKLDHPVKRLCDTEFGSILSYFDLCFGMNPFSPLLLLPPLTKEIKADMYQRRHSFLQSFSLPVLDFLSDGQLRFQLPGPLWIPYPFLHYLRDCRVARDAANEVNVRH